MPPDRIDDRPAASSPPEAAADGSGREVRLVVPASPEYLKLARLTAGGLASRLGFTYQDVEDLRIAIDELCFTLIGAKGHGGSVTLRYAIEPDELVVHGTSQMVDDRPALPGISELSARILAAVVDEHEVWEDPAGLSFRLRKRRSVP